MQQSTKRFKTSINTRGGGPRRGCAGNSSRRGSGYRGSGCGGSGYGGSGCGGSSGITTRETPALLAAEEVIPAIQLLDIWLRTLLQDN